MQRRKYQAMRESHVIQYLARYGPKTYEELMQAIPGNQGGRADRVARELIRQGRLKEELIKGPDNA